MEDNEMNEFSWSGLLLVTGCSFLVFCGILKFLDGNYPTLFLYIVFSATIFGSLGWLIAKLVKYSFRKINNP